MKAFCVGTQCHNDSIIAASQTNFGRRSPQTLPLFLRGYRAARIGALAFCSRQPSRQRFLSPASIIEAWKPSLLEPLAARGFSCLHCTGTIWAFKWIMKATKKGGMIFKCFLFPFKLSFRCVYFVSFKFFITTFLWGFSCKLSSSL